MIKRPFTFLHAITSIVLAATLAGGWYLGAQINQAAYPVLILVLVTGAIIALNLSRIPFDREPKQ